MSREFLFTYTLTPTQTPNEFTINANTGLNPANVTDTPDSASDNTDILGDIANDAFTGGATSEVYEGYGVAVFNNGSVAVAGPIGLNQQDFTLYSEQSIAAGTVIQLQPDMPGPFGANQYSLTTAAPVACYCSGTLIRALRGRDATNVAVEALQIGDIAITAHDEHRSIRWLGHRTIDCRNHPRPQEVLPIRIAAHAFGDNRPSRDLFVSPGHAICVDVLGEVLIPAGALINGSTIRQVEVDEITYWHVELDSHDVILAENLPAESYLNMGNRGFFKEADVVDLAAGPDVDISQRTYADFCRPYVNSGPVLEAVRSQLAKRAEAAGWSLTCDLDLHLEVDGVRVEPAIRDLVARFHVPAAAKDVWLVTPTARPCDTMGLPDTRDLGLTITGLRIEDGLSTPRDVPVSDPLLCIGFHALEDDCRRWTTGRARLPAALWDGCEADFYMRVELAGAPIPRWLAPAEVLAERPRLVG